MTTMAQMDKVIRRLVRTQQNGMFLSPPAYGKTMRLKQTCEAMLAAREIDYVTHFDGGTLVPSDMSMAMPDMENLTIQVVRDGRLPNHYDTPNMKGVIIFGEWMLMDLHTSKGGQKLINHEDLGSTRGKGFRLPDGVVCMADGNRLQDKAGAHQQSRPILSRFRVHEVEFDQDYALDVVKANYHETVAAFLIRHPQLIDNYTEVFETERAVNDHMLVDGRMGRWANLRSWDAVSRLLADRDATGEAATPWELAACTGNGVASTFSTYLQMVDSLASIEQIIENPTEAEVPERMDQRYALSTMLALTVAKDTFKPISVYMRRFPDELQAVFFRFMNERLARLKDENTSAIRSSDEYKKWITAKHISQILLGAVGQ
jgi:hypothetical protein